MPNIEMYGYNHLAVFKLREKIRNAFATYSEPQEVVTTAIQSDVEHLSGQKTAYLRIIASPSELEEVKRRLIPLGEDIEIMPLGEWIPKSTS